MTETNKCQFCDALTEGLRIKLTTQYFFVILDNYPVNKGHALIVSKRHASNFFSLTPIEWEVLGYTIDWTKAYLDEEFHPDGYNIGRPREMPLPHRAAFLLHCGAPL